MKQRNWYYYDANRTKHIIGFMHGQESGHVLVHINSKITIIDFNVLEPKTFSFYINKELVQIIIDKDEEDFKYELKIDQKAHEAIKKAHQVQSNKYRNQTIAFILGFVAIICMAIYFFSGDR